MGHGPNGLGQDVQDTALPATVNGGDYGEARVKEGDGLAVCLLNQESCADLIGHEGVVAVEFQVLVEGLSCNIDAVAMDLSCREEVFDTVLELEKIAVGMDGIPLVSNHVAEVKRV